MSNSIRQLTFHEPTKPITQDSIERAYGKSKCHLILT